MNDFPLENILVQLTHTDESTRLSAVQSCGRTRQLPSDERLRSALLSLLEDANVEIRRWAIVALSTLRDDTSIEAIGYALRDNAPPVRRRVCAFLIKYPKEEALVKPLIAIMQDESTDLSARDFAIMTLAHHPVALPSITTYLSHAPTILHRRLIHALMFMPDTDNLSTLERLRDLPEIAGMPRKTIEQAIKIIAQNVNNPLNTDETS